MKLNPDLLREVIFALEEDMNRFDPPRRPIDGYTWEETDAHICPLIELGFIDGAVVKTMADESGPVPPTSSVNYGLTAYGQLLALELRDDNVWQKVKKWAASTGAAITTAAVGKLIEMAVKRIG